MALLEVKNVDFGYYGSNFELKDVHFTLNSGERLALYGFEKSGKTTLLRVLCFLESYDQGNILLDGAELKNISHKDMNIGFTFDKRALDYKSKVCDLISYPMKLRKLSSDAIQGYLDSISSKFDIPMQSTLKDLSEMQIALLILLRLFSIERRLYLIDDVWKELPAEEKDVITEYLRGVIQDKTVIFATDDSKMARALGADKIIVLSESQVSPMLTEEEITARPVNMQSATFAGYELHIGQLVKDSGIYYASLYGDNYRVASPISEIYLGKRVCFAVKRQGIQRDESQVGDAKVMDFYYDLNNGRIIANLS